VQEIADQLDAYGVRDLAGDRDGLGVIVSDPSGWVWAAGDCPYAVRTISAWAEAEPRRGRHPWLINCATRLAAMHRWGCLTGPLHRRAVETLTRRMAELCEQGIGGQVRSLAPGEIADALTWGQAKAASKADEALPAELGAADGRHRRHQQAEPAGSNGPAGVMTAGDCAGGAAAGKTDPPRPPGEGSPVAVPAELAPRGGHTLAEADAAAEVVRERLRGQYVWSKGLGWLRWDAVRWEECSTEGVRREVSLYFRRRIGESDSPSLIKLLTRKALDGVTSLAGGLLEVEAERFDADPDVINCPNGVVDLRTGRLFPHDPERYLRKLTPVEYDPSAINHPDLPRVLECLADDEVREWMQLRLGQAVTGHIPPDDILPILFGGGTTGSRPSSRASWWRPGSTRWSSMTRCCWPSPAVIRRSAWNYSARGSGSPRRSPAVANST
jgi:D5-like protein